MASKVKRKMPKSDREREKSMVRFDQNVTSPLPSRRPLRLSSPNHLYAPLIHRQQTEKELITPLGAVLGTLIQAGLGPELDSFTKASAQLEFMGILNEALKALSRNTLGIIFQQPVYLTGFAYWQNQPEKRVICLLPLKIQKLKIHQQSFRAVFIQLLRSSISLNDLRSENTAQTNYMSVKKLYALILTLLRRILLAKSVPAERLHFSSTQRLLEVTLADTKDWVGEIVPCVVMERTAYYYCCKPLVHSPPEESKHESVNDAMPELHGTTSKSERVLLASNHAQPGRFRDCRQLLTPAHSITKKLMGKGIHSMNGLSGENRTGKAHLTPTKLNSLPDIETDLNWEWTTTRGNLLKVKNDFAEGSNSNSSQRYSEFTPRCLESRSRAAKSISRLSESTPRPLESAPLRSESVSGYSENRVTPSGDSKSDISRPERTDMFDVTWYKSCPVSEHHLLHSISTTDNGVRVSAMLAMIRMCQNDWRLRVITPYHVQTVALHDADHHVDATPRWQRNSLEHCTRSLLKRLHHFVKIRRLPHFFVQGVNLWEDVSESKMTFALSALDRLASSNVALISLVCRTGGFAVPGGTQIYPTHECRL